MSKRKPIAAACCLLFSLSAYAEPADNPAAPPASETAVDHQASATKDKTVKNRRRTATTSSQEAAAELDTITVTATRTEQKVQDIPASVSVISSRDLQHQRLLKPEDALRNVEGIDFLTNDSMGNAAVPDIRGLGGSFAGSPSSVLVDGMPTDTAFSSVTGRGGLNFVADQDIERMEVVRGPVSALYGPNVVGGVVNVVTKRWDRDTGGDVNLGYGSHNARSLGVAAGTGNELLDVRLSVQDYRTDGFKTTPEETPWKTIDLRGEGWKHRKWNINGGIRPTEHQEISFGVQSFRFDQIYGGSTWLDAIKGYSPGSTGAIDGDSYNLAYRIDLNEKNRIAFKYRHLKQNQSWVDVPDSGMGIGGHRSRSDILEVQWNTEPWQGNHLISGLSYQDNHYETYSLISKTATNNSAQQISLFAQDEQRFGTAWTALFGMRYDHIKQDPTRQNGIQMYEGSRDSIFTPRVALNYALSPQTSIYSSIGKAYIPVRNALIHGDGKRYIDNLDLKPETSISYEVGIKHNIERAKFHAAFYHTDYKNKVASKQIGNSFWPRQMVNLGKVSVDGIELGIETDLPGGWKPYANYSYTHSVVRENPTNPAIVGKKMPFIAPHKFNLGVIYEPNEYWNAALMGRYSSRSYFTDMNTEDRSAAPYFVADARVNVKLPTPRHWGEWTAMLAVNNLFDKRYSTWQYAWADRRNFWMGVNAKF